MLSSLSSTIITVFDIAELPKWNICRQRIAIAGLTWGRQAPYPLPLRERVSDCADTLAFREQRLTSAIARTSAETLGRRKRCDQARISRRRHCRRDVHGATAEREIECVSTEQVHQGDEDEQEGRLPAGSAADQVRLAKNGDQHDGERHERRHAVKNADEAAARRGQGEGDRDELKRQIDRDEPRHVEAEPLRCQACLQPWERSYKPKEIHFP